MGHRNSKFANPAFLTGLVVLVMWCAVTVMWPVVVIYYFVIMGLMFVAYGTYCSVKGRFAKRRSRIAKVDLRRQANEVGESVRGRSIGTRSTEARKSKWFEPADDLPAPPLMGRKSKPSMDI